MEEGDEETSESGDGGLSEIRDDKGMIKSLRKRILKEYHIIKVVGKGSYGTVTKARCKQTGKLVALKVMKNQTKTEYEIIKLLREI